MTSTRIKTALKLMDAVNKMDMATALSLRTPTCTHLFAPDSLGARPPLDNTAYTAQLSGFSSAVKEMPVTIKEIMEDEKQNRVIVWSTGLLRFQDIAKDEGLSDEQWEHRGEYIFILSMDESGEKIERVVEFVDSKAAENLRTLVARAKKNLEAKFPKASDA
ncbi:hypothetical protein OIDMADRAFT_15958 [Oidiodendron maius Zn]|uniref:SnoaL-like domain-containing protein n=1 Tax=Oidiodendron maius (strain Zn) TaxID=913774 RepID=A0A0C3HFB5_OIDMZ|nr:hypothetical protein OIDMADRAFT_15958 [Oidiodendron maius Zn]